MKENLAIASIFGAIGGVLGTRSKYKGLRNLFATLSLGFAEGIIGEFIEWVKSKGNEALVHVRYRMLLNN